MVSRDAGLCEWLALDGGLELANHPVEGEPLLRCRRRPLVCSRLSAPTASGSGLPSLFPYGSGPPGWESPLGGLGAAWLCKLPGVDHSRAPLLDALAE